MIPTPTPAHPRPPRNQPRARRRWLAALGLLLAGLAWLSPAGAEALDIQQIESRIQRLEGTNGEESGDNQGLLKLYREALGQLTQAQEYRRRAAEYKKALKEAPKQIDRYQKALRQLARTTAEQGPGPQQVPSTLSGLNEQQLNARIDKESARINDITTQLSDITHQLNTLNARPDAIRNTSAQVKSQLEELSNELPKGPSNEAGGALATAHTVERRATRQALAAEIEMLDAEQLSQDVRQEALQLHQELLKKRLAQAEQALEALRGEINRRGSQAAEEAQVQASKAVAAAEGKHPLISRAAEINARLSQRLQEVSQANETTTQELGQSQLLLRQIDQNYQQALQQLEITRLDKTLGQFLRDQRSKLPNPTKFEKNRRRYSLTLDEYRLAQLRLRAEQSELLDLQQALKRQLAANRAQLKGLSEKEVSAITRQLEGLLKDRKALLEKLDSAYSHGIKLLNDTILEQQRLRERISKYGRLLDENLLWVANEEAIDLAWLQGFAAPLKALSSPDNWLEALQALGRQFLHHCLSSALVLAFCVGLLRWQRAMRGYLARVAGEVGKVRRDHFLYTLNALGISILLAIPWAILMAYGGWLLRETSDLFPRALGSGLASAAETYVVLKFFRLLYIPHGLAKAHFHWQARVRQNVPRHLSWFLPLAVTLSLLIGITETTTNGYYRDTLGRLAFMLGMLALMLFIWRIFNIRGARSGVQPRQYRPSWVWRTRYLWYPLLLLTPLVLLIMTAYGYHYPALQLANFIFHSIFVLLAAVLLYSMAVRWLLVAQRRLAMERAMQKRQAELEARASREASDQAGEITAENIEIPEIDLSTINEQTRRLMRLAISGLAVVGLWLVWRDLLPALGVLKEVTVWQYSVPGEEGAQLLPISLADLGAAGLVLALTLVAERNLPGLLEIALLQPLKVERGNRYAVASLIRYLILIIGILSAFSLIGIGWNQVQWLVAAIGVGLGFGLKEIFANFISGIIVLFERPVRIGDTVTIGDISGIVSRIRMRSTTVTDFDNKELIIPNQRLIVEPLINWTLSDQITRVKFTVGIAYGSDTTQALRLMNEVVTSHPQVLEEPTPTVFFVGFGDSSLDFEVRAFVRERSMRLPLLHDLHMALEKVLREHDIEIPFPQRDLHLRSADAPLHWAPDAGPG